MYVPVMPFALILKATTFQSVGISAVAAIDDGEFTYKSMILRATRLTKNAC